MELSGLIALGVSLACLASIIRALWVHFKGEKVQKEIKAYLVILLFLGTAQPLASSVPQLGEKLVKPVISIAGFVSDSIVTSLDTSKK